MPVAEAHPSGEDLAAFALGTLDDEGQASIENHVAACTSCQERAAIAPGDTLVELLRRVHARAGRWTCTFVEAAAYVETPIPSASPDEGITPASALAPSTSAESVPSESPDIFPAELAHHERYRVCRLLGAGGMGAVYEAMHLVMQKKVALKVIRRAYTAKADALERFRREVRTAARLSHPNIVPIYDAEDAGATHFLVMEYVAGTDLGRLVQERGPLPVDRACEYVRQAALGLQHAFEQGMVHRDLKPHNLMLAWNGRVQILDFGLARFASEAASAGVTDTGLVLGTVDYIAPEQADSSRQADIRSDIYSLGCTLYHLLTGQPPFPAGTALQKVMAHIEKKPQSLTELCPHLPEGLMTVLERMMAKNPKHRYQTPAEVAVALESFICTPVASDDGRTAFFPNMSGRRRRQRRFLIATAMLAILVSGLLGWGVYRIATDHGELVIQTDNDDVEVTISKGGKVVKIMDRTSGKHVTLNSGDYELALKDSPVGLTIVPERMTVKRGDTVLATVERVTDSGLIKNGSFEAGIEGWETYVSGPPPMKFDFDRDVVKEGRQSLRATANGEINFAQQVELKPREWYHVSGWVRTRGLKVHGATAWGTIVIKHPPRYEEVLAKGDNHLGDTEWTPISFRFQAPDDGKVEVFLTPAYCDHRPAFFGGMGMIWFDGLKLVEEAPPPAEKVGEIRRFEGHTNGAWGIAISPDGRHALSGAGDGTVRLWDVTTGREVRRFSGHNEYVEAVAFSPDGRQALTAGHDRTVHLWDVQTGNEIRVFKGHTNIIHNVAFSPDGRRALSAGDDDTMRLWDLESGQELRRFPGFCGLAFSPDGRLALSGEASGRIGLWDVETGAGVRQLLGHQRKVTGVVFLPGGRQALSCSHDGTLRLWDLDSGQEIRRFSGHTDIVNRVAITRHGRYALSASGDKTVRLWDLQAGKELHCFTGHTDQVGWVAVSPDGRYALSGGAYGDGTMRLWRLPDLPPAKQTP
jgi:WD40 repeat protein/serine/threonine protein kinase